MAQEVNLLFVMVGSPFFSQYIYTFHLLFNGNFIPLAGAQFL